MATNPVCRVWRSVAYLAIVIIGLPSCLIAEDWPQFRGVNCEGISSSSDSLPTEFSSTEHVKWAASLGDGIGSPVVAAGRAFVSEMVDERTVALVAFDAKSGKQLWRRTWDTGELPEIHRSNSHASTTPAADAERVYFYFSTLGMLCVDAATGEDRWQQMLPVPYLVFKWGPGMSPVLHGGNLIFVQDDDLSPAIYVFDARTGKVRWQESRNDMCAGYSHPVVYSGKDGDEVVVAGTGRLIGYDLATGKRKWFARVLLRNIKTTTALSMSRCRAAGSRRSGSRRSTRPRKLATATAK